jgi:hypothetical protein
MAIDLKNIGRLPCAKQFGPERLPQKARYINFLDLTNAVSATLSTLDPQRFCLKSLRLESMGAPVQDQNSFRHKLAFFATIADQGQTLDRPPTLGEVEEGINVLGNLLAEQLAERVPAVWEIEFCIMATPANKADYYDYSIQGIVKATDPKDALG